MKKIIDKLLKSENPIIKYKLLVDVLNENHNSKKIKQLQQEISNFPIIKTLINNLNERSFKRFYQKWTGANWILLTLADLDYPANDKLLLPKIDTFIDYWLNPEVTETVIVEKNTPIEEIKKLKGVPLINNRYRRCACQQAIALFTALKLDTQNKKIHQLVDLLLKWQWPDGGWNCDRNPEAKNSSFYESFIPLRALGLYSQNRANEKIKNAIKKSSEVFLKRELFKSLKSGFPINNNFLKLHYPYYWRYNILIGLKVLAENNLIHDTRCSDALDIIENKYIENNGWPAEIKYYKILTNPDVLRIPSNSDLVDWGGVNKKEMNEWITIDALYVLVKANRIKI